MYNNESIEYFCDKLNFSIKGKWIFGADAMDLYRKALITLEEKNVSKGLVELFSKNYLPSIDAIQLSLDNLIFFRGTRGNKK
ncbi:hypothetical protein [Lysinibacillus sphaericus]|uniref:hypothetical protein n=1 Tax=Lysinibacillus sphaericus TaxID=1421 RepID=UPI000CDF29AA|nr:hypothetical protein [Lysinibacillus sphaericus]